MVSATGKPCPTSRAKLGPDNTPLLPCPASSAATAETARSRRTEHPPGPERSPRVGSRLGNALSSEVAVPEVAVAGPGMMVIEMVVTEMTVNEMTVHVSAVSSRWRRY